MTEVNREQPKIGSIAIGWWKGLQSEIRSDGHRAGNPGALARLRRADLAGAAMEEVAIDLFKRLAAISALKSNLRRDTLFERTALVAAVLAHVHEHDNRKVAAVAGEKEPGSDQRTLHPLRLRRLFAAHNPADCLVAFRRLVALLGKKANVADLAETLLEWPDEKRGDARRTRWAFDYYGAGRAAPEDRDHIAA
jgi:CRISPR type I-E-associated protein CasB/Cse2